MKPKKLGLVQLLRRLAELVQRPLHVAMMLPQRVLGALAREPHRLDRADLILANPLRARKGTAAEVTFASGQGGNGEAEL